MIIVIIVAGIIAVAGAYSIVELMIDAHRNGESAHEATERAGSVEVREE